MRMLHRSFVMGLGLTACVVMGNAVDSIAATSGFACHPVRPGDTAAKISARLMNSTWAWREPGFQIFDPVAARFIPKAGYRRIQPGWQVCVIEPLPAQPFAPPNRQDAPPRVTSPLSATPRVTFDRWWLWLVLIASVMAVLVIHRSSERKKAVARTLERFAADFICEFERPLRDERAPRSVLHAEVSVFPQSGSMEVLLAPTSGRSYPNLGGHRTNVEYDIQRVLTLLDDRRFSCGPLRSRGPWIAIPFRLASTRTRT
jgi:hypothetical protein